MVRDESQGTHEGPENPDWEPLEDEIHEAQIAWLLHTAAEMHESSGRPVRILELGCGSGRAIVPLAQAGYECTGIDRDSEAIAACRARLGEAATLIEAEFTEGLRAAGEGYDLVLCLGHTFMLVHDPLEALALLCNAARALAPGGRIVLDDIAGELWPNVADGSWVTGMADDGSSQLIWAQRDNVLAVREGEAVDEEADFLQEGDRLLRLWTFGEMRLLAAGAGLSEPVVEEGAWVVWMGR